MKNVRPFVILVWLVCVFAVTVGATDNLELPRQAKKAEELFGSFDYLDALEMFQIAHTKAPDHPFILRRIADCYRLLGMEEESVEWYQKSVLAGPYDEMDYYYCASALRSLGQDEAAVHWINQFFEHAPDDSRAQRLHDDPNYFQALISDKPNFNTASLGANVGRSLGPPAKGEELMFVPIASGIDDGWYPHKRFLVDYDLYATSVDDMFNLVSAEPVAGEVNSLFSEGPSCYDRMRNVLYVTRFYAKKEVPTLNGTPAVASAIISFKLVNGEWKTSKDFPFNDPNTSQAYPALSPDGNSLYFSSNKDGHGFDIYVATRTESGWGEPRSLNANINTEGDEIYPAFGPKGEFIFASNGHPGLGGLDIFFGFPNGSGEAINPGMPVNSRDDDFGMMYIGDEFGYFCSDREATSGGDDLFWWETWHEVVETEIVLMSSEGLPMNPKEVEIRNLRTDEAYTKSAARGSFVASLNGEDTFEITWKHEDQKFVMHCTPEKTPLGLRYAYDSPNAGKFLADAQVLTYRESAFRKKKLPAQKWKERNLTDQTNYAFNNTGERSYFQAMWQTTDMNCPEEGSRVFIKNVENGGVAYFDVNNQPTAEFEITKNQLHVLTWQTQDGREMKVFFTPDNEDVAFADATQQFNYAFTEEPLLLAQQLDAAKFKEMFSASADSEGGIVKADDMFSFSGGNGTVRKTPEGLVMSAGAVYFAFDSGVLSKNEFGKLGEIIGMLADQPDLKIKINAHTDARGDKKYNLFLSKKRAMSTRDALVKAGISSDRIVLEWNGEDELVNDCSDGKFCSTAQHKLNRRAELSLLLPESV